MISVFLSLSIFFVMTVHTSVLSVHVLDAMNGLRCLTKSVAEGVLILSRHL